MASSLFPNVIESLPGTFGYAATDLGLDDVANEVDSGANDHYFTASGKDLILVFNSTAGALDFTVVSQAHPRTGQRAGAAAQDTLSVGAGLTVALGPFGKEGWVDVATNRITIQAEAAGMYAAVVRLNAV